MSDKDESSRGTNRGPLFTPPEKPPRPSKVSIAEIAALRKIFEDSSLAKWVVLAGIGGAAELLRALVDIVRSIKAH